MFCGHCGTQLADNTKFCPNCGAPVQSTVQPAPDYIPVPKSPYAAYDQVNGRTWAEIKRLGYIIGEDGKSYGIGWMKFQLYFSFFASAVLNFITAITVISGAQYGKDANLIYAEFPALKNVDIIFGLLTMLCSAALVFVRFQISSLKRTAMRSYLTVFILSFVIGYGYLIAASAVIDVSVISMIGEEIGRDVTSIVMFIINYAVYFKHRSSVFVN